MVSCEAVVSANGAQWKVRSHRHTYHVGWQRPQPQPGPRLQAVSPCYRGAPRVFQLRILGFVL
jgi:hypothetical protein